MQTTKPQNLNINRTIRTTVSSVAFKLKAISKELGIFPPTLSPEQLQKMIKEEALKLSRLEKELIRIDQENLNAN